MTAEANVNDDDLASAVRSMEELVDTTVHVYELDKEKTKVTDDIYKSLKILTSYLSFSVDLYPQVLSLPADCRVILTPSLDLLIIKPNNKSETRRFDQLTLDETTNVLKYAGPALVNMARADLEAKNKKVAFLRESVKKLKRIPSASSDDMIVTDASISMEKAEGE